MERIGVQLCFHGQLLGFFLDCFYYFCTFFLSQWPIDLFCISKYFYVCFTFPFMKIPFPMFFFRFFFLLCVFHCVREMSMHGGNLGLNCQFINPIFSVCFAYSTCGLSVSFRFGTGDVGNLGVFIWIFSIVESWEVFFDYESTIF